MIFVDANRAAATTFGQKDNKKALNKRKKEMAAEHMKNYKKGDRDDAPVLDWETYYTKVQNNMIHLSLYSGAALQESTEHTSCSQRGGDIVVFLDTALDKTTFRIIGFFFFHAYILEHFAS